MTTTDVRIESWLRQGFELYKDNAVTLILASLIALAVSALTAGILSGPMFAGLVIIALRLYDGETPPPEAGDVFKGFDVFLSAFLFNLVWGLIAFAAQVILGGLVPGIGHLAGFVVALSATAAVMFGMFLIVEKRMEFWPASMASFETVKASFFPFLAFYIAVGFIGSLGTVLCGIGVIVTFPIMLCSLTVAYRDVFSAAGPSSETMDAPPPAPPPGGPDGPATGDVSDAPQAGA